MSKKIILALDTSNLEEAIKITKKIKDKIFTVKLGLEFFNANGKQGVKKFIEWYVKYNKVKIIKSKK